MSKEIETSIKKSESKFHDKAISQKDLEIVVKLIRAEQSLLKKVAIYMSPKPYIASYQKNKFSRDIEKGSEKALGKLISRNFTSYVDPTGLSNSDNDYIDLESAKIAADAIFGKKPEGVISKFLHTDASPMLEQAYERANEMGLLKDKSKLNKKLNPNNPF